MIKHFLSFLSPQGSKGKLTILLFHKIPKTSDCLTPYEQHIGQFEKVLDFAEENLNVLSLSEGISALKRGKLPERAVAFTFDDGYADWHETVIPALKKRNFPATFFISTEQFAGAALWHERIIASVRALPDRGAALPFGFGNYTDLSKLQSRIRLVADLQERLKYASLSDRLNAIDALEAQATSYLQLPPRFDKKSVRALHSQGFEIGGHTIRHPILNECTYEEAMEEIGRCKEELQATIGGTVNLFAYPNGRPNMDYGGNHIDIVKACGYKAAVATCSGVATMSSDFYQLPRFSPWGLTKHRIAHQITRNLFETRKGISYRENQENVAATSSVRCLLIASAFPPVRGGSAVVYGSLCSHMPRGSIRALAPKMNYLTNTEIDNWKEHDVSVDYPIHRLALLRPLMMDPPANIAVSLYRFLFQDIPLNFRVLISAAQLVYRHKINIICIGELVSGAWIGLVLRKIFGCKVIIYVHGEEITTVTEGRLHGKRRKQFLEAADKIVAVSSFTCDVLTKNMGLRPEKISLIQNGVDVSWFKPGPPNYPLIAKHNLQDKKIILTVARLVPRKGIDMSILAMKYIIAKHPNVHYLIVGDGMYHTSLQQLIRDEGMAEYVTLVGKADDAEVVAYFRICDLFLMPNRTMPDGDTEGFGLVFREANACRKPVIGGRAGGAVEAVIEEVTGLLVNGNDPLEIANATLRVLGDANLAKKMGDNGYRIAHENSTQAVAKQFEKVCARVLNAI